MEEHNDALLERASSSETVTEPRRSPNGKALKVAGLTVLACLLLAGQAFTAYYVVGQKDHLQALEQGQDTLKKELTRMLTVAPKMMNTPMSKMPLMRAFDEASPKQRVPLTRLQSSSFPSQKEGSGLVDEGPRVIAQSKRMVAAMNHMPLYSLQKLEEEEKTSALPAFVLESKCKIEAGQVKPGFFEPQCDEEGHFKPKQCWHSTGYCWCVDKNGKEIPGTLTRGPLECGSEPILEEVPAN
ncbi:CD74 molecule, major histocompatibility complex, class II invariant chain a isoform X1 [Ictalurus punctatus]|uniref:CD74 molecule, major histocompatibility complex, class II invariant chain a isoform X1 n=1 Tax=Ictalurus punctatus TaxID=7998 RepID=W5ULL5_ICTPU|nr:CD74 molecule, major histocompatibility complex, class II invariant chain a isoform X1 [Ictalurus punctatus]